VAALNVPEMSSRRARASGDFEVKNRRLERGEIGKHVEVCPRATRPMCGSPMAAFALRADGETEVAYGQKSN